jgi:hypothetical protein
MHSPVGASLLAKRPDQTAKILDVTVLIEQNNHHIGTSDWTHF